MEKESCGGAFFAVIALVVALTPLSTQSRSLAAPNVAARLDGVVQPYVISRQFMGSVLVAQGAKVLLDKGYGYADLEWQIPDSPKTKFRLASITKQFTAACILLLAERGRLRLDDPVAKYVANAPAAWNKITIFNLLTHTSGIPNFTDFPDYESFKVTPTTPAELMARFLHKPLDFPPGQKWEYSNSGYVVLGYIIEKITGQTYKTFVEENIFRPLGMSHSGYDSNSAIIPHRASGYSPGRAGPVNAPYIDMSVPFAAGGLYSTTHDLLRWEEGLFGGKLLTSAFLREMTTPFKDDYACGLWVRRVNGQTVMQHDGEIDGFSTELAYYPLDKLTVVVLGNLGDDAPQKIAAKLASLVLSRRSAAE